MDFWQAWFSEDVGFDGRGIDGELEVLLSAKRRAVGALVGLAVGDALGAPVEFKVRGSFPKLTEMQSGGYFQLPAGAWTDDTAMALCLADSLIAQPFLDVRDLLDRFLGWLNNHENTSTGRCIGAGQNTLAVLGHYHRTGALEAPQVKGRSDGNGAIMRLAPVACMHFRNIAVLRRIAASQSRATHCSELSSAASEMLGWLLGLLIDGADWDAALSIVSDDRWPIDVQALCGGKWAAKAEDDISSAGYVLHTLEAALWAVGTTTSFEEALIKAVNLGHDADTVGAVAGQIAGARYGIDAIPERWLSALLRRDLIEERAHMLFAKRPLPSFPDSGSIAGLIEISDRLHWCQDWHCGTCGAARLRRGLEKVLGLEKSSTIYSVADMERLAGELSGLKVVIDSGTAEALLLLASRRLGRERMTEILENCPARLHYDLMWNAHASHQQKHLA